MVVEDERYTLSEEARKYYKFSEEIVKEYSQNKILSHYKNAAKLHFATYFDSFGFDNIFAEGIGQLLGEIPFLIAERNVFLEVFNRAMRRTSNLNMVDSHGKVRMDFMCEIGSDSHNNPMYLENEILYWILRMDVNPDIKLDEYELVLTARPRTTKGD